MPSIAGMSSSPSPLSTSTLVAPSLSARSMRGLGVLDPEGHGAGARAVGLGILLGVAAGLGIDDEVAVALLVQGDVLALVPGDLGEAHFGEQRAQQLDVGRGIFDESKPSVPIGLANPVDALFVGDLRGHVNLLCGPVALAAGISRLRSKVAARAHASRDAHDES